MSQHPHFYPHNPPIPSVNNYVNHANSHIQYPPKDTPLPLVNPLVNANSYPVQPPSPYQDYSRQSQNDLMTKRNELERKIQHLEQKYVQEANQTIDKLLEYSNNQLLEKERKIDTIFAYLQEDAEKVTKSVSMISSVNDRIAAFIENEEQEISLRTADDWAICQNPQSQELLDLLAQDAAMEDCMYALLQALNQGIIDLESYMKKIRTLTRNQFICRAQANKVEKELIAMNNINASQSQFM